jgi:hypothetical protein
LPFQASLGPEMPLAHAILPSSPAPLMPHSAGFVPRRCELATRRPRVDPNPFRP